MGVVDRMGCGAEVFTGCLMTHRACVDLRDTDKRSLAVSER